MFRFLSLLMLPVILTASAPAEEALDNGEASSAKGDLPW